MNRYLFDLDSTLIIGYMDRPDKDFSAVELLPGVLETWKRLRWETGNNMAIVTNQGGVAFGYNSEEQVLDKFRKVAAALGYAWIEIYDGTSEEPEAIDLGPYYRADLDGILRFWVCYADARSQDLRYNDPAQVARRKPSGMMIREAVAYDNDGTPIYIGDRPEDEAAARDAGVEFRWAAEFFHG